MQCIMQKCQSNYMIQKQHKKTHIYKVQDQKYQFDDLLNCQICYCKANQPTMCPHCSKLYCQNCISTSMKMKTECPNCRKIIKGQLTNCTRFINELTNIVNTLIESGEQLQKCIDHGINLNYFCQDCGKSACCECKMFGEHQSHGFKPISIIYQQKYNRIRDLLSELKAKIIVKQALLEQIQSDLTEIRAKTQAQLIQIDDYTEKYRAKITKQNVDQANNSYQSINSLIEQINQLDQIKQQIIGKLEQAKKHNCYKYDAQLIGKLQHLLLKNKQNSNIGQNIVAVDEAVPAFQKYHMLIQNYSLKKQQTKPIYSDIAIYQGSQWRLVIYMRGNTFDNQYISIFLELMSNPDCLNMYEYQIQMVNGDRKKNIVKDHHSKFQVGECWGYNKFAKIDDISESGFVNKERNCLQIQFGLKFSYYCDLYKRRQLILERLSEEMSKRDQKIEELEMKIAKDSRNSIDLD